MLHNRLFTFSVIVSVLVHVFFFPLYFRYIHQRQKTVDQQIQEAEVKSNEKTAENHLSEKNKPKSPFASINDSTVIHCVRQIDSISFQEIVQFNDSVSDTISAETSKELYEIDPEMLQHLLTYRDNPQGDSILGISEILRSSLVNKIIMNSTSGSAPDFISNAQWKDIIDHIGKMLTNRYGYDSTSSERLKRMISQLVSDSELMHLWKQAMMFSLQEATMQRLIERIQQALSKAMKQCASANHTEGAATALALKSSGSNFAGIDFRAITPECFEKCLSTALQSIGGNNFLIMASFFNQEELLEKLTVESKKYVRSIIGNNPYPSHLLETTDFKAVLSQVLKQSNVSVNNGKQIAEFVETLNKSLGEDIDNLILHGPSRGDLFADPYIFYGWAEEYIDLITRIVTPSNLLVPNIDSYAEAVKKIRQRYLNSELQLSIGKGTVTRATEELFISPQKVLVEKAAKSSLSIQMNRPLENPDFFSHNWGGAVRRSRTITIDGRLDEWSVCAPYELHGAGQGLSEIPFELRSSNALKVQWDNQGFYFAYRLYDIRDNIAVRDAFWATDALELFFDPYNFKDSIRIEGQSYQFWIWPRAQDKNQSTGQSKFFSPVHYKPFSLKNGIIQHASIRTGTVYTCEVFVPSQIFKQWHPLPGKIIGFNYSMNNGEGILLRWVTNKGKNISGSPNLWGDLLLMGSDASIDISPADFILPGQNITITVTDHDMNLDAKRKDKIWVKIKSRLTGDLLPVSLIETHTNSGVFETIEGTVFGLKPHHKNKLSIRPGDIVTVYYLDQHSSGGMKNIPREEKIFVGRGVLLLSN